MLKRLIILLVLNLLIASYAYAETATVMGQIVSDDKTPIVKATVSLGDEFDFTDVNGRYRIKDLPFGKYTMQIKKEGKILKEVEIEINQSKMTHDEIIP